MPYARGDDASDKPHGNEHGGPALTVKDSTVRFVGENEAWDGSVAELEHCRRAKLELEKLV